MAGQVVRARLGFAYESRDGWGASEDIGRKRIGGTDMRRRRSLFRHGWTSRILEGGNEKPAEAKAWRVGCSAYYGTITESYSYLSPSVNCYRLLSANGILLWL